MIPEAGRAGLAKSVAELAAMGRQSGRFKMRCNTVKITIGTGPEAMRQPEGIHHADRNRFAMQDRAVISRLGFIGMPECMAEIEQGPAAAFALILFDDLCLGPAAMRHGGNDGLRVRLSTAELFSSSQAKNPASPRSPYFTISAYPALISASAGWQGNRYRPAPPGLVKGADQILAGAGIDAGLAANGTVDLGKQGCWQLDEIHPSQEAGRGKPHKITNDAAAQRHQHGLAVQAQPEQVFHELAVLPKGFGCFPEGTVNPSRRLAIRPSETISGADASR